MIENAPILGHFKAMAERKGFEPSVEQTTQTFQVCTIDHSDTSLQEVGL